METKARFTLIAFYVLAVVVAGQTFAHWIVGARHSEKLVKYQLVFPGPAPGLVPDGAVLFNGLQVGRVTEVGFLSRQLERLAKADRDGPRVCPVTRQGVSKKDPDQVYAVIEVGETLPIKVDTKAYLDRRSLVGSVVVSLSGGKSEASDIPTTKDCHPVIVVDRPVREDFVESLQNLSALAPRVFDRMGSLLEQSRGAYFVEADRIEPFRKTIADHSRKVEEIVEEAKDFTRSLKPILEHYDSLLAAVNARTPQDARRVANGAGAANSFADVLSQTKLDAMERFAVDARRAARSLDRSARALERDPRGAVSDKPSSGAATKKGP